MKKKLITLVTALAVTVWMVGLFPAMGSASTGGITAIVGGGVSSASHVSGAGDWTFTLVRVSGQVRTITVAVRLESCSGPVHGYVEARKARIGQVFTIPNVPLGRQCARASAEGAAGSEAEFLVSHPTAPAAGTVITLRPAFAEPFILATPRWPLWVSAVVVGSGDEWDQSTNQIDWYDYFEGSWILAATNMAEGYLSLAVGTHTLVPSLTEPGSGTPDGYTVIVLEEVTVTLGTIWMSGSTVYLPVSVRDHGAPVESHIEATVFDEANRSVASVSVDTGSSGDATLAFRLTRRGTYRVEVSAHGTDHRFGWAEGTFTK